MTTTSSGGDETLSCPLGCKGNAICGRSLNRARCKGRSPSSKVVFAIVWSDRYRMQPRSCSVRIPAPLSKTHTSERTSTEPRNDFPGFVEPAHMSIACGEVAVGDRVVRVFLDREEELRQRLVEAPAEKMCCSNRADGHADPRPRAEPYRRFDMLDRNVGPTRKPPQDPAHIPTARITRVEASA